MADDKTQGKKLSAAEQAAADKAELDALNERIAAENAAQSGGPSADARIRKAALERKMAADNAARRAEEATIEATVARGTMYVEPGLENGVGPGGKVMLTPAEYAKAVQSGHVHALDGNIEEPAGPRVLREAGLLQGHSTGQVPADQGKASK